MKFLKKLKTNQTIRRLLCTTCVAAVFVTGCSKDEGFKDSYNVYSSTLAQNVSSDTGSTSYFADDLCVTEDINYGTDQTDSWVAEGAGVFNLDTKQVLYSQNLFEKLYPASTTKIMTAYIIVKNANLDDMVTVNAEAVDQASDSSVAHLKEGDVISVRDLLYGLMLPSGNDAAIMLADYYSGSVSAFAEVMNAEALRLGATNTHYVNANGLPDDDHYTTVYDMYLIFSAALQEQTFVDLISTTYHDAVYTDKDGNQVTNSWHNTNGYLTGAFNTPDGFQIIGGKTGTTNEAGYCLVLYSLNPEGQRIVSIVFKADCRLNLYLLMSEILSGFAT